MARENTGRRWKLLVLAGAAGFVGRGGIALSPATLVMLLLALFVVVFLVTLALSVSRSAPAINPAPELGDLLPTYLDPSQSQNEAVYGSP